jgi:thiol-disulfide isomerase/thioredoxin
MTSFDDVHFRRFALGRGAAFLFAMPKPTWNFMPAIIFSLCVIAGCQQSSPPGGMTQGTVASDAGSAPAIKPADVKLAVGDEKALAALIEQHAGQVVFVDYWAIWCKPCVEYFPHTVQLSHKYKDQGLATISVSFDAPDDVQSVRDFLGQKGADFDNVLSSYDSGPAAFEGFDIEQVPHFRLYDRQGRLRYKRDATSEDAEPRIAELLAEKP